MISDIQQVEKDQLDAFWQDILSVEEECFSPELRFTTEELRSNCESDGSVVLVIAVEGITAGFLNAVPYRTLDYMDFDGHILRDDTLYIVDIAVRSVFRNRGLGVLMLKHLVSAGTGRRFTAHAVNDASKRMFLRAGFREEGIFEDWMGGHAAVFMTCEK